MLLTWRTRRVGSAHHCEEEEKENLQTLAVRDFKIRARSHIEGPLAVAGGDLQETKRPL